MIKTANEVISAMQMLENPEQRKVLMEFFKTGKGQYGEGDEFLGLKVPETRAFVKEYRGRGIGRRLLEQGIENGKVLNLDVTLAVDPINDRAKKLYQSLGFKPSGTLFIFGHEYEKMTLMTTKGRAHRSRDSKDL